MTGMLSYQLIIEPQVGQDEGGRMMDLPIGSL
jgi:hypothetical protein